MMRQLNLEVPDSLAQRLAQWAAKQKKSVEQMALELLASADEPSNHSLDARYQHFLDESGLFVKVTEEEKKRYQPASEERLKELADKLGAAGPLSQVIIEERGPR
jgi:hypothetical protein